MDNKHKDPIDINKYYSSVDKNIIDNLCKNDKFKNLLNLSIETDINIFNKKYNKWHVKSKDKLLKECEIEKKTYVKNSTMMLSNLAKLNQSTNIGEIKDIYDDLENKICKIDKIITHINNIDTELDDKLIDKKPKKEKKTKSKDNKNNFVSFDLYGGNNETTSEKPKEKFIPKIVSIKEENIITIKPLNDISVNTDSSCENYIECYANC